MLVTMGVNQVEVFISMTRRWIIILFSGIFSSILFLPSCKDSSNVTEQIPTGPINLIIDLNLGTYQHLSNVGEFAYVEGGVKGVLIIHDYDDAWYAFERSCAYQPTKNCSKIWVDTANIQLRCGEQLIGSFTECCNSKYMFSGLPTSGMAKGRLARYNIQRDGNILQIYN